MAVNLLIGLLLGALIASAGGKADGKGGAVKSASVSMEVQILNEAFGGKGAVPLAGLLSSRTSLGTAERGGKR